ncbi:LexA family transcriptional regulator [Providencia alcalifaciens]|uniref:XRE family transcriptional regulator n=1 Tax=Providencia TaxID=586 RepID=UPI0032DB2889
MTDKKRSIVEFSERLKSIIPKGSGREFAHKAGISYSTFHNYINAQSSPTLENLVLLSKACDVSIEWLATGNSITQKHLTDDNAKVCKIPVLGTNEFLLLDKSIFSKLTQDIKAIAAIRVENDAMHPTLVSNSIVLVDTTQKKLKEGKIIVIQKDDYYSYRLVQITTNGYLLKSTNKNYIDIIIDEKSLLDLCIIGEIILSISIL